MEARAPKDWVPPSYFVFGFSATITLSWILSALLVKVQGVSNFEGGVGLATLYTFPQVFVFLSILLVIGYFPLRRYPRVVSGLVAVFVLLTLLLLWFVIGLL